MLSIVDLPEPVQPITTTRRAFGSTRAKSSIVAYSTSLSARTPAMLPCSLSTPTSCAADAAATLLKFASKSAGCCAVVALASARVMFSEPLFSLSPIAIMGRFS